METDRAAVAALIFIVAIVGINFVMYGIVRGFTRGGAKSPLETMMKALDPPGKKRDDGYQELRQSVRELTGEDDSDKGQKSGDF